MRERLIEVGFWAPSSQGGTTLAELLADFVAGDFRRPDVRKFVDPSWNTKERVTVLSYITNRKFRGMAYCGYSECRLCSKRDNGSADFSDGVYVWPEGFGHYVAVHHVRPPTEFVQHVLRTR